MPKKPNEFREMLKLLDAQIRRQERDGWDSPAVEKATRRLRMGLWACANNTPPGKVILQLVAEDTEKLARARAAAKG